MAHLPTVTEATTAYTAADIITEVAALVPPLSAPTSELVKAHLPRVITEATLKRFPAEAHLVNIKPTGALPEVLEGPIPHRTWLASLQIDLDQARRSGRPVTGIRHPTIRDLILPVWALSVWDSIAVASQQRTHWMEAALWLRPDDHRPQDLASLKHAGSLMAQIPWAMTAWPLQGSGAVSHVGFLANFISSGWLNARNIDLMIILCNAVAVRDINKARSHVAPVWLGAQLQTIGSWDDKKILENRDLGGWKARAVQGGFRYIHIPVNFINVHWVIFCIDIEAQTYCWGDPMAGNRFPGAMGVVKAAIERWTEVVFGKNFRSKGRVYPIGQQKDDHSCGICVINAFNAFIHGGDLFKAETSAKHRLQCFIEAAEYLLHDMDKVVLDVAAFISPELDPTLVIQQSQPAPSTHMLEEDDTNCLVQGVADSLRLGQSYQSIGFGREHAILNRALSARVKGKKIHHERVLTEAAQTVIANGLQHGLQHGRKDAREPPYMLPSADPEDYSAWCSLCNDFGSTLLLCAGCRVGICVRTRGITGGCLEWDEKVTRPDLLFYCLFCTRMRGFDFRFKLRIKHYPRKADVWFRYDPPVLIVGATLHKDESSFCRLLHHHMLLGYRRNTESVMLLEVDFDGNNAKEDPLLGEKTPAMRRSMGKARRQVLNNIEAAGAFLEEHKTAKIIISLDTHCFEENGLLVYSDADASDIKACSLETILHDCIPLTVRRYIEDGPKSLAHAHKSIILNLACGATIGDALSRSEIFNGHCADAVLSFANEITLVAGVAAPLLDFTSMWVQSNSDYDFIIAQAFPPKWCSLHRPVLSRPGVVGHWAYSAIDPLEPDGYPVFCHRGCGREHLDPDATSQTMKFKCLLCKSTCEVTMTRTKGRALLATQGIHKVVFPTRRAETNWSPPEDQVASTQVDVKDSRGRTQKANPSRAQGGRVGIPAKRLQTHSMPRPRSTPHLPSQMLPQAMPPIRTLSQAPPQHPHPAPAPPTHQPYPSFTPSTQQSQGVWPLQGSLAPQMYLYGWPPAAQIPQPHTGTFMLQPPHQQTTPYSQHRVQRRKVERDSSVPPSQTDTQDKT